MGLKSGIIKALGGAAKAGAEAGADIVGSTSKQKNTTQRHLQDMQADNKLSKLIRPLVTLWAIAFFTAIAVMGYFGLQTDPEIKSGINLVLGLAVGFYFPGRTLEKWIRKNTTSLKKEDN